MSENEHLWDTSQIHLPHGLLIYAKHKKSPSGVRGWGDRSERKKEWRLWCMTDLDFFSSERRRLNGLEFLDHGGALFVSAFEKSHL